MYVYMIYIDGEYFDEFVTNVRQSRELILQKYGYPLEDVSVEENYATESYDYSTNSYV